MNEHTLPPTASSRSRTRKKLILTGIALLLAIILIGLNVLAGLIPWKISALSLTDDPVFGLSSSTKNILTKLDEDITLYMLCEDGELNADRDLLSFLKNYEALSSHISVKVVNSKTETDFLSAHGIAALSENAICFVVESNRRYMLLSLADLYYYYYSDDETELYLTPAEYATSGESLSSMGYTMYPYFNGEEGVTNAIRFVTMEDVPVVAIVQAAYQSEDGSVIPLNAEISDAFVQSLRQKSCDIRYILNVSELTEEHDILLYNSPLLDLTQQEASDLTAWLNAGGNMILTTYCNTKDQPNLASVLNSYGLSADEKNIRVTEGNESYTQGSYYIAMVANTHQATVSLVDSVIVSDAHAIYCDLTSESAEVTRLLYTTAYGYREQYDSDTQTWTEIEEDQASYTYGAVSEKGDSKVIWISTPYLFDLADPYTENGNYQLLFSSLNWMSDAPLETVDTEANAMSSDVLLVSITSFVVWLIILIVVLPLTFLSIGLIRRYLRKRG